MDSVLSRRMVTGALGASVASIVLPSIGQEQKSDKKKDAPLSKKEYMTLAIADIQAKADAAERRRKELAAQGGAAPLFVRMPNVIPFVDWDYYYTDGELRWAPEGGSNLPSVRVPKGFVTDLASVPPIFWSKYPPIGRYAYAAVVHDYLYWHQTTTKKVADEVMFAAMKDAGTSEQAIADFRGALTLAGGFAWEKNKRAREAGERRLLKTFPESKLIAWADYQKGDVFGD